MTAERSAEYSVLDAAAADRRVSDKSSTEYVDLTEELNLTELRGRVWHLEPGHDRKASHVHETQEELYYVIEGPGRMTVGGDTVDVAEESFVRVPPETPRRLFNDTDEEHVWLIVGAPPVEGDGQPLE